VQNARIRHYTLRPNGLLWQHFAAGYKLNNVNIQNSDLFQRSLIFSLLRTINYYGELLGENEAADRVGKHLKALQRISDATLRILVRET